MFKALRVETPTPGGQITEAWIQMKLNSPATEGLSDLFKSGQQKIMDSRAKALQKIADHMHSVNEKSPELFKQTQDDVKLYVDKITALNKSIKGKKFNTTAFASLVFTDYEYNQTVIDHALYHMDDVKNCIKSAVQDKDYDIEAFKLHDKNRAYLPFDGIEVLSDYAPKEDLVPHYCVEPKTKVIDAGYTQEFISHVLSTPNSVVSGVNSIISLHTDTVSFADLMKQKISQATDRKKIEFYASCYIQFTDWFYQACIAVSDDYLTETVRIMTFIVKHCYT